MGRTGSCLDNAVAETWFASLKVELVHRATAGPGLRPAPRSSAGSPGTTDPCCTRPVALIAWPGPVGHAAALGCGGVTDAAAAAPDSRRTSERRSLIMRSRRDFWLLQPDARRNASRRWFICHLLSRTICLSQLAVSDRPPLPRPQHLHADVLGKGATDGRSSPAPWPPAPRPSRSRPSRRWRGGSVVLLISERHPPMRGRLSVARSTLVHAVLSTLATNARTRALTRRWWQDAGEVAHSCGDQGGDGFRAM
jgi:hypothetical protein